ncbi:MAG: hypothetical protein DRJ65_22835 [Acidobacteria bacterium]|nr:MAG: hypothetical protein DRJ65_22835 [Acidobacteriota bacterium]
MGLSSVVTLPLLGTAHRDAALRRATEQVRSQMWRARADAMTTGRATALVFDRLPGGGWRCAVVQDGDDDGVRRNDIATGLDYQVGRILELEADKAGLGFIADCDIPNPSGDGLLAGDLDDPVRIGSGNILTFTAQGTATSGTLYFSDGRQMMRAIRVYGITGRLRTLRWKIGCDRWRIAHL